MSPISLLLIAFSLAMDAFAVSLSAGFSSKNIYFRKAFFLALTFGVFQAIMPLIGWIWGLSIRDWIEPVDHWIAFLLLGGIGVNMIREAFSPDEEEKRDYFSFRSLMTLGLATSIDALAVGISLALLPVNISLAVGLIGIVTGVFCFLGVYIGKRFGHILWNKAEIIGGLILIGIGTKILIEHICP